ncbi:MAG: peptide deformylase [Lactobacillus sp.]|jgi:peptide deformylase|nr:peptide deformylase [Lactobacillus sp.]
MGKVLEVYEYPHPVLKKVSLPVDKVDDELRAFLDDMLETMYASVGVGLAAPQVGVSKRIIVIDIVQDSEEGIRGEPLYMVNPEIIWRSEEMICGEEGCLSIPGQRADVDRHQMVRVRYLDYHGECKEVLAEDYLAVAIQHELDHLDGILYIDRISRLKRSMLLKKLAKERKEDEEETQ